mmetsp:Transcript_1259/g.3034  ORF Transcript_1259/g.3034 Transcript_1259/m.3034 type:complete len:83 (-) Transcript_1259:10-258(-)
MSCCLARLVAAGAHACLPYLCWRTAPLMQTSQQQLWFEKMKAGAGNDISLPSESGRCSMAGFRFKSGTDAWVEEPVCVCVYV